LSASAVEELKPIDEILKPDFRSACRGYTIEVLHELAAQHDLSVAVPENVRHQFEIARHAYVYAALYTPLCAAAEFYAILAVEHALRLRYIASKRAQAQQGSPGLKQLLRIAISEGWIRDDGFDFDFREQVLTENGIEHRDIPIDERRRPTDIVLELLPSLRNELAHGQPSMALEAVGLHLQRATEIINQLFSSKAPAT
jgi:hypothetical protein